MNCPQVFGSRRQVSMLIVLSIGVGFSAGCGSSPSGSDQPRGEVMITVAYGGEPVTGGQINLISEKGGEDKGGELNDEGIATVSALALGKYKVTIFPPMPDPTPLEPGQPAPKKKMYPNIPKKFRQAKTSPLTIEVSEDSREIQFDLKEAK